MTQTVGLSLEAFGTPLRGTLDLGGSSMQIALPRPGATAAAWMPQLLHCPCVGSVTDGQSLDMADCAQFVLGVVHSMC